MPIDHDREGGVSVVTIRRPDAMNSFDLGTARALADALEAASDEPATDAILLEGEGGAFCTGADLAAFHEALEDGRAAEAVAEVSGTMNHVIEAIVHGSDPVVACVDGVAAGGGLGLALACDVRIASERARFTPAFLGAGVSPDGGTTWFLPRMIGFGRARELILRNETLDASTAKELGLVGEVVGPGKARARALSVARKLAEGPSQAIGWAKQRLAEQRSLREHLAFEREATVRSAETEEFREGVEAFLEKREPEFG